jgi:hypothetical protein
MFRVEYYCPRQSPFWQPAGVLPTLRAAILRAQVVKPPRGNARVLNSAGFLLWQI